MADISNIRIDSQTYSLKDSYAREHFIDAFTTADIQAILNFVNGLKVNGNNVISSITATATTLESNEAATVTVSTSTDGVASFTFGIPKGPTGSMNTFFSGTSLIFEDPEADGASYLEESFLIG